MAKCELCAFYSICPDVGVDGHCDGYISAARIGKNSGNSCIYCKHFCAEACTCVLDPEGDVLSIHYCCDRFERK